MFNPVSLPSSAYGQLAAQVGSPYGVVVKGPSSGMDTGQGGPTFGSFSISEPNTSPDVVSVRALPFKFAGTTKQFVPSGTPVVVFAPRLNPNRKTNSHGVHDPTHLFYRLQDMKSFSLPTGQDPDMFTEPSFVGVTIGDVWAERTKPCTLAMAVQNVTNVFINQAEHQKMLQKKLGDKVYIGCTHTGNPVVFRDTMPLGATADNALHTTVRVATIVAPMVGNTMRMDLGEVVTVARDTGTTDAIKTFATVGAYAAEAAAAGIGGEAFAWSDQ